MKKNLFILCVGIAGFVACKDKKTETATATETATKTETLAADPSKDSAAIRTVIIDFYNWYSKEYKKLMGYNLYSSIKKKEMPPYKINWDEVDKLQSFIRSTVPQLGEEFLKNQRIMLQQADSAFKVDVEDEIPYGFDYDWYTNSQEDAQYTVDEINKAKQWIIAVNGDDAIVDIKGTYTDNGEQKSSTVLKLAMKKENGNWKIAKIGME